MKITILYDNTVYKQGLESDWGFSCLVEVPDKTILFDTGSNGSILLENMKKLNVDLSSIDDVFISHAHFDHTGGLSAFLNENSNVKIFAPVSFRGVRNAKEVIYVSKPTQLYENIFSTGELDHIEQSMAVKTDKGLVLVVGCSHPKMQHIIKAASQFGRVYGIIGGLHGFDEYELFQGFGIICPTHCTQHITEIKSRYPEKYVKGGTGKIIEL